uniref:Uncharacterized protein n=1 Tax=Rhizophora mucronata TaxID=61149 RepID=A0A2P2NZ74_RHIMU
MLTLCSFGLSWSLSLSLSLTLRTS